MCLFSSTTLLSSQHRKPILLYFSGLQTYITLLISFASLYYSASQAPLPPVLLTTHIPYPITALLHYCIPSKMVSNPVLLRHPVLLRNPKGVMGVRKQPERGMPSEMICGNGQSKAPWSPIPSLLPLRCFASPLVSW